jgi:hypothetical protein
MLLFVVVLVVFCVAISVEVVVVDYYRRSPLLPAFNRLAMTVTVRGDSTVQVNCHLYPIAFLIYFFLVTVVTVK